MKSKIKSLEEIEEILDKDKREGFKIVHCHGVFDLLHPGHIRHFKSAKAQGDKLVVSVTPDRFVNKGPGRPAFTESLRLESLAALEDIDYVVLNDAPDAIPIIRKIRPSLYVKGIEYANHASDVTGKISEEARTVQDIGGQIFYTDDIVFSSSNLLNRYVDPLPVDVQPYIENLKKSYSADQIIHQIDALANLKVLIIGDAIIDEYQYTEAMGQSGKGLHMCARCLDKELFLGGALIIANHIAQFSNQVTLLTALGKECPNLNFIQKNLDRKIETDFVFLDETTTLTKKRYVLKDGKTLSKLFETYSGHEEPLNQFQTDHVLKHLHKHGSHYDLIVSCDFGNGFSNPQIIDAVCDVPTFLALNTQLNSGNRGYNVVTNYRRADFISLNEPEIRLATHNKISPIEGLAADISIILQCPLISITRGVNGVFCFTDTQSFSVPAFASSSIDRIGAGDSYLSLASLCLANKLEMNVASFIGSLASAMSVQMIGNSDAIKKASLCKFVSRLLK